MTLILFESPPFNYLQFEEFASLGLKHISKRCLQIVKNIFGSHHRNK